MNGSAHIVIGCSTALLALQIGNATGILNLSNEQIATGVVIAGIAALMPDIDHPSSTISRTALWFQLAGMAMLFLPSMAGIGITYPNIGSSWITDVQAMLPPWPLYQIWGYMFIILAVVLVVTPHTLKHRGPTHSIFFTFIVTAAVTAFYHHYNFPLLYGICFGVGWTTHLLADASTGLPALLWPFRLEEWI